MVFIQLLKISFISFDEVFEWVDVLQLFIYCLMQVPSLKRKSSDGSQSSEPVGIKQPVTLTGSNAEQYVQLESALRKQIEV